MPIKSEICIKFPGVDAVSEDENIIQHSCHGIGEGPTCGLIPIMGRCEKVITTGLQWNLNGDVPLEFGGLVSSSNRIVNDLVTIETSSPMLFTTEIIVRHDY
jgi:thiamine pyrophosphokinase